MLAFFCLAASAKLLRSKSVEQAGGVHGVDHRDGTWHLDNMLGRFEHFAEDAGETVAVRHAAEKARLEKAVSGATLTPVAHLALEQSIVANDQSKQETDLALTEMEKFISTLQQITGRTPIDGSGKGCAEITCGPHASCTRSTRGAECVCDEGFVGDGVSCTAPVLFVPQRLLRDGAHGQSHQVADIHVAAFLGRKLVLTYRDVSNGNEGKIMLGDFTDGSVAFGPPEKFGVDKAYDPMCIGLSTDSVVVAYRDDDRKATLFARAGQLGATGIRGADKHITWGPPLSIARGQAHRAALLPLAADKAMVMYKDATPASRESPERHFCAARLLSVGAAGAITDLGTYHALEFAATRLAAIQLTPTSFVVAYRGAKHVDELDGSLQRQEASVIYGELADTELVFDPHPLDLEPAQTSIWERGVSLLGPNTFGYAYQAGLDQTTRISVVRVDSVTHRMSVLSRGIVQKGFTPYVSMVDIPYTTRDPHTLTYYQKGSAQYASVCEVDGAGHLSQCEEHKWLDRGVQSVSSVPIGGGRTLFAYADEAGVPYVQVVGLSKK